MNLRPKRRQSQFEKEWEVFENLGNKKAIILKRQVYNQTNDCNFDNGFNLFRL
jgi:hypothetical protein